MKRNSTYQIKEVAKITGISVRALHHYDEIELLVPSGRTEAGYRLYNDENLLRLQQILIGRELGLSLEEIRSYLDDPHFDQQQALMAQREKLKKRVQQTTAIIRAIDEALSFLTNRKERVMIQIQKIIKGGTMNMQKMFDGFDPLKHEEEAQERFGNTDLYKESIRRTSRYTTFDWNKLKSDTEAIYRDLFAVLKAGKLSTDPEVLDIVERHRLSIDRWFYPCNIAMHCKLADMYESDNRFAANIDKYGEGLTKFLIAAIRESAAKNVSS